MGQSNRAVESISAFKPLSHDFYRKRVFGIAIGIGGSALAVALFVLLGSGMGAELVARTGSVRLIFLGLGGLTLDIL